MGATDGVAGGAGLVADPVAPFGPDADGRFKHATRFEIAEWLGIENEVHFRVGIKCDTKPTTLVLAGVSQMEAVAVEIPVVAMLVELADHAIGKST